MYLVNGRCGSIDLATGEASEEVLSLDPAEGASSLLSEARRLSAAHGDGALVFGAGLLTGSLVPAACGGFVLSPDGGVVPLIGSLGVELKLSGFDILAVTGKAPGPGYVWVRDGVIELVPSPEMRGMDSWQRTDRIRADQGDRRIQVVSAGPWGDAGLRSSQLVMDYWGGEDKVGCAGAMGAMSLAAVAFRGMGELEVADPDGHFRAAVSALEEHRSALGRSEGLASFTDVAAREGFRRLLHRNTGCYGCPFPCRSFYKVDEDPGVLAMESEEPGYLLYDTPALDELSSAGVEPRTAVGMLVDCAKAGAEPVAALRMFSKTGAGLSQEPFREFLEEPPPDDAGVPERSALFDSSGSYRPLMDVYLGLGICPRYWDRVGFGPEKLSALAETALGEPLRGI